MKKVSILVPCYNEEASLPALYDALHGLMEANKQYDWEVLLVNDGSRDRTMEVIKELRAKDSRICYIDLSRNFGKENAMLAGFDHVTGDCMVIMDADLQHPPHVVPEMLKKWEEGYDDVYGQRLTRGKESWLRKRFTKMYYSMLQKASRVEVLPNVGDFRLLDRKCIEELKRLRETQRYTKGMYCWIGFKKTSVPFETQDRVAGESHMSYSTLLSLATDGLTSFTVAPLKLSVYFGFLISIVAFIYLFYVLCKAIVYGDPVAGYPTLVILVLFFGGLQLISLGIIGEYLGKIYYETKSRPAYVVSEKDGV